MNEMKNKRDRKNVVCAFSGEMSESICMHSIFLFVYDTYPHLLGELSPDDVLGGRHNNNLRCFHFNFSLRLGCTQPINIKLYSSGPTTLTFITATCVSIT